MIITIREPTEAEMKRHLERCGWDKTTPRRADPDKCWFHRTDPDRVYDIYTAFIHEARMATEAAVFKP